MLLSAKDEVADRVGDAVNIVAPAASRKKACQELVQTCLPFIRDVHNTFDQNALPGRYKERLKAYEKVLVKVLATIRTLPYWQPQGFIMQVERELADVRPFVAHTKKGAKPYSWAKVVAIGCAGQVLDEFSEKPSQEKQLELAIALCCATGLQVEAGEDLSGYPKGPAERYVTILGFTTEKKSTE